MGENKPQGNPSSVQHGHRPGQEPSDIDQDRGSFEPGSNKPDGDGKPTTSHRDERKDRPSKGDNPNSPQPGSVGDAGGTS